MTDLPRVVLEEAARLLGAGGAVPTELEARIGEAYAELDGVETPRCVWRFFSAEIHEASVSFDGAFFVEGRGLAELLRGCSRAALLAVTLGAGVDRAINRLQATSMSEAVIFDACASAAAEALCDRLEGEIAQTLAEGEFLTMRYSPGYGDVPPAESAKILAALETRKRIGLTATASGMLIPIKSITAVIGVAKEKRDRKKSCSQCGISDSCPYKKRGGYCGL